MERHEFQVDRLAEGPEHRRTYEFRSLQTNTLKVPEMGGGKIFFKNSFKVKGVRIGFDFSFQEAFLAFFATSLIFIFKICACIILIQTKS